MTNVVDSVWEKVEKRGADECWPWTGRSAGKDGRGRMDIGGVEGVYAPRAAYISVNPGAISLRANNGVHVLHRCDNPVCCNPSHLFIGDHADNMADKVSKGRQYKPKGTESPRAKLSAEDVADIRLKKRAGATKKALALLYDVSVATISGALYGRHYRDVQ